MLKKAQFLFYLSEIFKSPENASEAFRNSDRRTALDIITSYHIPFLILITIFSYFSLPRLISADFSFSLNVFLPAAVIALLSLLAAAFDRLCSAYKGPSIENPEKPLPDYTALLFTFPMLATGPLFFIHPLAGYAAVLLFFTVYTVHSVRILSEYHGISVIRAWSLWIFVLVLMLAPLIIVLFILNLIQAVQILRTY